MLWGMSADDYWNGDPKLVLAYQRLHELRIQQRNEEMWLQGIYVYKALESVVGNALSKKGAPPIKYFEEPLPILQDESAKRKAEEKAVKRLEADLNAWAARWKAKEQRNGGKGT